MTWKQVKSLFWQSSNEGSATPVADEDVSEISDEDFAALLSQDEFAVPAEAHDDVDPSTIHVAAVEGQPVSIDFQEQYDLAEIPNSDEVEQLENFLSRLDGSLSHAAKIASAEAFLGAIGKSREDVLADAERKIKRVHGIKLAKDQESQALISHEQEQINQLTQQIEAHRQRIEAIKRELDGVGHACMLEESRLQAARVFFGHIQQKPNG